MRKKLTKNYLENYVKNKRSQKKVQKSFKIQQLMEKRRNQNIKFRIKLMKTMSWLKILKNFVKKLKLFKYKINKIKNPNKKIIKALKIRNMNKYVDLYKMKHLLIKYALH